MAKAEHHFINQPPLWILNANLILKPGLKWWNIHGPVRLRTVEHFYQRLSGWIHGRCRYLRPRRRIWWRRNRLWSSIWNRRRWWWLYWGSWWWLWWWRRIIFKNWCSGMSLRELTRVPRLEQNQNLELGLGSRRWNWKFREKAWEKQDTEILLHSSYSFWPWLSTSGSGWNLASTQQWKKFEK